MNTTDSCFNSRWFCTHVAICVCFELRTLATPTLELIDFSEFGLLIIILKLVRAKQLLDEWRYGDGDTYIHWKWIKLLSSLIVQERSIYWMGKLSDCTHSQINTRCPIASCICSIFIMLHTLAHYWMYTQCRTTIIASFTQQYDSKYFIITKFTSVYRHSTIDILYSLIQAKTSWRPKSKLKSEVFVWIHIEQWNDWNWSSFVRLENEMNIFWIDEQ